jgi:hypothetical protein
MVMWIRQIKYVRERAELDAISIQRGTRVPSPSLHQLTPPHFAPGLVVVTQYSVNFGEQTITYTMLRRFPHRMSRLQLSLRHSDKQPVMQVVPTQAMHE